MASAVSPAANRLRIRVLGDAEFAGLSVDRLRSALKFELC